MKNLLAPASLDDAILLLRAWRFWVLGAVLGGLIGYAIYFINPPDYRARATVVVSFNMEKSWPNKPDNELFYYLERESRKLEEVAWADKTIKEVSSQTGLTITELRSGKLELSQPQDGGWHFYATDPQASTAEQLAKLWAQTFVIQTQLGIQTAVSIDAARKALESDPGNPDLLAIIKNLEASSLAITPDLQISLSQGNNLPVDQKSSPGIYALSGAGLLLALTSLWLLLGIRKSA